MTARRGNRTGIAWHRLVGRELRRGLGRFLRVAPLALAGDLSRAWRLCRHDPLPRPMPPRAERVIVALTTIPARTGRIAPALRSLVDQTRPADRVLLAYPDRTWREGIPYPPPPPLPPGVELMPCADEGPATKLLPALAAEPEAAIIVADDDVIYPVNFVETLLEAHRADPAAALGLRGVALDDDTDPRMWDHVLATAIRAPVAVDILFGTWGYLVPPGAFDDAVFDFTGYPPALRFVDDVWVSGHLARRGIARRVVPARHLPIETGASPVSALTLGPNRSGENDRAAIAAFAEWW